MQRCYASDHIVMLVIKNIFLFLSESAILIHIIGLARNTGIIWGIIISNCTAIYNAGQWTEEEQGFQLHIMKICRSADPLCNESSSFLFLPGIQGT